MYVNKKYYKYKLLADMSIYTIYDMHMYTYTHI